MPVRARSASSIAAIAVLPPRLMSRSSSSSASTPSRMTPPSRASAGGSSTIVASIASRTSVRSSISAARLRTSGACRLRGAAPAARGNERQRLAERDEIARAGRAERDARDQPLEVVHALEQLAQLAALGRPKREVLDGVEPILNPRERDERTHAATARSSRPPIAVTVRSIVVEQRARRGRRRRLRRRSGAGA